MKNTNPSPLQKDAKFVNISLTWTGACKVILAALTRGTPEGKKEAEAALFNMAAVADMIRHYPNGIESWKDAFFDITLSLGRSTGRANSLASSVYNRSGYEGLRALAEELASNFEDRYKDVSWESRAARGVKLQFFMLLAENDYHASRAKVSDFFEVTK